MTCWHPVLQCKECGFKPDQPYSAEDRPEEYEDWYCDDCIKAVASHEENAWYEELNRGYSRDRI